MAKDRARWKELVCGLTSPRLWCNKGDDDDDDDDDNVRTFSESNLIWLIMC